MNTKASDTLIRFDGVLSENLQFEPKIGWETERIAHPTHIGNGEFVVELLDGDGRALIEAFPEVDFEGGCPAESRTMRVTRVVAYLPNHPSARGLRFRKRDLTIYERELAIKSPSADKLRAQYDKRRGRVRLSWSTRNRESQPLYVKAFYFTKDGKRGFPISCWQEANDCLSVSLEGIPGGKRSRFGVLVSDGLRSAYALSNTVDVDVPPPNLSITLPSCDGESYPFGDPVSLCGQAYDGGQMALPEAKLQWSIDGKVIAEGECQAIATNLEPGEHQAVLSYHDVKGKPSATAKRRFRVDPPTREQQDSLSIMESIEDAAAHDPFVFEAFDQPEFGNETQLTSPCSCAGK